MVKMYIPVGRLEYAFSLGDDWAEELIASIPARLRYDYTLVRPFARNHIRNDSPVYLSLDEGRIGTFIDDITPDYLSHLADRYAHGASDQNSYLSTHPIPSPVGEDSAVYIDCASMVGFFYGPLEILAHLSFETLGIPEYISRDSLLQQYHQVLAETPIYKIRRTLTEMCRHWLLSLTIVDKTNAVSWLASEGFSFERETKGLNRKDYEHIISQVSPATLKNNESSNHANNKTVNISIKAGWADKIEAQVAALEAPDILILEMKAKKQYTALISWLRGKTFSEAYNIANPPQGERSGDMSSNGKRYCKTAYKALKDVDVTIDFSIDDIKGK